jgi:hypothetical protein
MVTGAAVRDAAVAAQDKITEMELDGNLSPGAAKSLRGTVRAVDVGASLTVSAVTGKAAKTVGEDGSARAAVRNAVQNPAGTAQACVEGLVYDPKSLPKAWESAQRHRGIQGLAEDTDYLIHGSGTS